MTQKEKGDFTLKVLRNRIKKYGGVNPLGRPHTTWQSGWREIGGKKIFFRSKWEMNYARWLEYKKSNLKEIADWFYEPETFWFEKIMRGVRSYKPDFKIINHDGSFYFDEVKGWMDSRSKTTLKRMKKYYPAIKVNVIDAKWFKSAKKWSFIIPGWEK